MQRLTRPFLHAERLAFTHPRTGERLSFTAPLPKDLEDVLMAVTPLEMREHLFGPPPEEVESDLEDDDERTTRASPGKPPAPSASSDGRR